MGLLCAKHRSSLFLGLVLSCSMLFIPQTLLAVTTAYTYDAAGRLLTAQYGDGQHIAYTYDAVGNMTQQIASGFGGGVLIGPIILILLNDPSGINQHSSILNNGSF